MSCFEAEAVLFDMDGTLTDSIAAVEAAWARVALELGRSPEEIIALTHGKRAADNLAHLKPEIEDHAMDDAVAVFEQSILAYADAFSKYGHYHDTVPTPSSGALTPALVSDSDSDSRAPSPTLTGPIRPGFITRLSEKLIATARKLEEQHAKAEPAAWEIEAATTDRSVKILPGVRRMLSSIPKGRYAVATSGAATYAFGCMERVGIHPPEVTITGDDKRLEAGKPAPDPFLLAAKCLGFEAKNCVVFEDSPSGIKSGVASGATVIAVCTSHERAQLENCGAHYIVEDMSHVTCKVVKQGEETKLRFTISA
ncbi:HAD-like protein [Mycena kentingensis (nom. inval.)]|nr:HAD-like protein [Mycena kentingensis (nom. inval.)]